MSPNERFDAMSERNHARFGQTYGDACEAVAQLITDVHGPGGHHFEVMEWNLANEVLAAVIAVVEVDFLQASEVMRDLAEQARITRKERLQQQIDGLTREAAAI
jgi:hypothetical protein